MAPLLSAVTEIAVSERCLRFQQRPHIDTPDFLVLFE